MMRVWEQCSGNRCLGCYLKIREDTEPAGKSRGHLGSEDATNTPSLATPISNTWAWCLALSGLFMNLLEMSKVSILDQTADVPRDTSPVCMEPDTCSVWGTLVLAFCVCDKLHSSPVSTAALLEIFPSSQGSANHSSETKSRLPFGLPSKTRIRTQ